MRRFVLFIIVFAFVRALLRHSRRKNPGSGSCASQTIRMLPGGDTHPGRSSRTC